jgi:hypothetical protein
MAWAIGTSAALTFLSGAVVALVMREKARGAPDVTRAQTADSHTIASPSADTKS